MVMSHIMEQRGMGGIVMDTNVLYYGDNLEILRKHIPDESIDLIYLDPPFNSKASYNVLFKEPTGEPSQAQITAFEDTWHWSIESEKALLEIMDSGSTPIAVKELMRVLPNFLGNRTDMRAYLVMMCIRLLELRRVLKETGAIYLHCDPTASHYLKIVMDAVFGTHNFVNELIWQKIRASKAQTIGFGKVHDVVLYYSKTQDIIFNSERTTHSAAYLKSHYRYTEPETDRIYRLHDLTQAGGGSARRFGDVWLEPPVGKHWIWTQARIDEGMKRGLIVFSKHGMPSIKRYLDEVRGNFVEDIWVDIPPINAMAKERLGYPTQKPEALLERIINVSSNEGDIVLDPFCGCGTAIVVGQKLGRKWVGIDITHLAISTMKWRLEKMFPSIKYQVVGEPIDLSGARDLFNYDKYQFQYWAVSLVKGQPYGDKKKGADTGIDGFLYFQDEKDKFKKAIISVKGGKNVHVDMIRDLCHVVDREKADMGLFITLEPPTKPMRDEAIEKGLYKSPLGKSYPKMQILTVEELLVGSKPEIPPQVASIYTPAIAKKDEGKTARML